MNFNGFHIRTETSVVMAGHIRPKDGVASLAYVPAIHAFLCSQDVDARHKLALGPAEGRTRVAGHDGVESVILYKREVL